MNLPNVQAHIEAAIAVLENKGHALKDIIISYSADGQPITPELKILPFSEMAGYCARYGFDIRLMVNAQKYVDLRDGH